MNKKSLKIIIWTVVFSVTYAIIRYHFFKGLNFSLFIVVFNKGISLASILLISFSFTVGPLARQFPNRIKQFKSGKRLYGLWGFALAFFHTLISLLIFNPNYYSQFFSIIKINIIGEFILVTGFLSLLLIGMAFITSFPKLYPFSLKIFSLSQFAGFIGLVFGGLHVFPIGVNNWGHPKTWPGYLFPITLISFLAVLVTIYCRAVLNSNKQKVN